MHLVGKAPRNLEAKYIPLKRGDGRLVADGECSGPLEAMQIVTESCLQEAVEFERTSARIVIGNFHEATSEEQSDLIKKARGIQEVQPEIKCQFVFAGHWGYYAFREAYRKRHGQTVSPPAHSKEVVKLPGWSVGQLNDEHPHKFDPVVARFVIEQTGGDEYLIRQAVKYLERETGNWGDYIEHVLDDELTCDPDVDREMCQRMEWLDPEGREELEKLLHFQKLRRRLDNAVAEQLWVAGLARFCPSGSGWHCIEFLGPVVEAAVRNILHRSNSSIASPRALCFKRATVSAVAYQKIAEIEMLLRNVVVQQWYKEDGETWEDKFLTIRTLSSEKQTESDKQEIVAKLEDAHLADAGGSAESVATKRVRPNRRKLPLLEVARKWKERQLSDHAVDLARDNLTQFLTTEALMSVLLNKKNGLAGDGRPFEREHLSSAISEYIAIRSAVAHNQALKLNTIPRLDELSRKFTEWLTVFADKSDKC